MRNAIAIFLILCANIVLVAHAVVSHHHHDNIACFIFAEEHGHDDSCSHDDANHQQKHDAGNDNDCCTLNDILAIIPDYYKQENQSFDFIGRDNNTNHYFSITFIQEDTDDQPDYLIAFRQKPYLANSFKTIVARSHRLRGPPSC